MQSNQKKKMIFIGSHFIICFLLQLANGEDTNISYDMVKSALGHYRTRSVVLVIDEKSRSLGVNRFISLQKRLSSTKNLYFSSFTTLSGFWKVLKSAPQVLRETVVIWNPKENFPRSLLEVSKNTDITLYKWLLTTSTLTSQDFDNLTIPVNAEFTMASGDATTGYNLTEVYDIRPGVRLTNALGRWVNGGEEFQLETSADLFKRRKNFKEIGIKVVAPKRNCCEGTSFAVGVAPIVWCIHQRLWDIMAKMLNATTKLQVIPELTPDTIRKADAELTFRSAPLNAVDLNTRSYVWPIFRVKVEVVTSYVKHEVHWETYVLPFSKQMWTVILIGVILGDVILASTEFILSRKRRRNSFTRYCTEFSFRTAFVYCNQGTLSHAKLPTTRIIFLMTVVIPAVLFPGYSAILTSYLTVHMDKKPFRNLEELSRTNEYKLGWHNTFALEHMFNLEDTNSVTQALLHNNVLPQEKLPATDAEAVERICNEKFSYLTIIQTILALKPKCRYYRLKPHFRLVFTSMEMKKNSWYKYFLDRCERNLDFTGILYRIEMQTIMKYVRYDENLIRNKGEVPPIKIENIVLPFAVLLLGLMGSIVFLTLELISFKLI